MAESVEKSPVFEAVGAHVEAVVGATVEAAVEAAAEEVAEDGGETADRKIATIEKTKVAGGGNPKGEGGRKSASPGVG